MNLLEKIRVIQPSDTVETGEDIFSSALGTLFTDDLRNEHGDPGALVVYKSRRFGDVTLKIAQPATEDDRRLFAHYLWNASLWAAEAISGDVEGVSWDVEAEMVLELGAGLGLVGIIAAFCGASRIVLSDYPTPTLLENISNNVQTNVPMALQSRITVAGHEWGNLQDHLSTNNAATFTRIFAADCLWMPGEHRNLAQSMHHLLSRDARARVYVIAGFHTGRAKLAPFFEVVVEEGFQVESIREIDIKGGEERLWARERDGGKENVTERKRWLVVAVLKLNQGD